MSREPGVEFSDQELVNEVRAGSGVAFERLMRRYERLVFRIAYGFTGNEEHAMDVTQETFLKAVDNIDSFRLESSFGTWLYSIAMNVMRTCFAKRKRMQLKPIEDYLPDHSNGTNSKLLDWADPHDLFENEQIRGIIDEELEAVWAGDKDAQTALDSAVEAALADGDEPLTRPGGVEQQRTMRERRDHRRPRRHGGLIAGRSSITTAFAAGAGLAFIAAILTLRAAAGGPAPQAVPA